MSKQLAEEVEELQWTSPQPNFLTPYWFYPAVGWIVEYKQTGEQVVLPVFSSEEFPAKLTHPEDISTFATHLLALDDVSPHNHGKYILHGPENFAGRDIVKMVADYIGAKVENVKYSAMDVYFNALRSMCIPDNVLPAMFTTVGVLWAGRCARDYRPISKEVTALAPPKTTAAQVLKAMVEGFP
ncbi:hypothetical protein TrVGV298_004301 [Trichoderma virens]|nr:hypothetical protein TrVGV298_004301 [Trichoderma virens]